MGAKKQLTWGAVEEAEGLGEDWGEGLEVDWAAAGLAVGLGVGWEVVG